MPHQTQSLLAHIKSLGFKLHAEKCRLVPTQTDFSGHDHRLVMHDSVPLTGEGYDHLDPPKPFLAWIDQYQWPLGLLVAALVLIPQRCAPPLAPAVTYSCCGQGHFALNHAAHVRCPEHRGGHAFQSKPTCEGLSYTPTLCGRSGRDSGGWRWTCLHHRRTHCPLWFSLDSFSGPRFHVS